MNKVVSKNQEKNVAKSLGGKVVINSGATPFYKGDVIVGECIIECKTKTKEVDNFTIKKSWIEGIEEERIAMRKSLSALAISFDMGGSSYYLIDEKAMKILVNIFSEEAEYD